MTDVLRVDPVHPDVVSMTRAAQCLRDGGLVAFPTETVYGLGAHALDRAAVRRLFEAKGRPANDPLIVHVTDVSALEDLTASVPAVARALAARFWPGPLTLVMHRGPRVPDEVTAGLWTVAIRVPAHPIASALLHAAAIPIAAPSANLFSRPSPTLAAHVLEDLDGRIDLVIDGGATQVGLESTVVDLTTERPTILRPGAITIEMLREVAPGVRHREAAAVDEGQAQPSPGLLSKHYAPRAPLTLYRGIATRVAQAIEEEARRATAAGQKVGILAGEDLAAARLYAALRELDAQQVDRILAADTPDVGGISGAIRDRLSRAAARVVVVD